MGHAIAALTSMSTQIQKNPTFIAIFGVLAGVLAVVNAIVGQIPLLGWIASGFLLGPAIQASLVAIAAVMYKRAEFTLDVAVPSIKENWLSLAGARLVGAAAFMAVGIVVTIIAVVGVGVSAGATEAAGSDPTALIGALGVTTLLLGVALAVFVVALYTVFQFVGVAIVLNGASAVESFRQSVRVCLSQPGSVFAYTLLNPLVVFVPVMLIGGPLGAIGFLVDGFQPGLLTAVLGGLGGAIGYAAGSSLSAVYHVSFFSRVSSAVGLSGDEKSTVLTMV